MEQYKLFKIKSHYYWGTERPILDKEQWYVDGDNEVVCFKNNAEHCETGPARFTHTWQDPFQYYLFGDHLYTKEEWLAALQLPLEDKYTESNGGHYKNYCKNGIWHRDGAPAVVYSWGEQLWYTNGNQNRLDGPAVIKADGSVEYWIDNVQYKTEEEYLAKIERMKTEVDDTALIAATPCKQFKAYTINRKKYWGVEAPVKDKEQWFVSGNFKQVCLKNGVIHSDNGPAKIYYNEYELVNYYYTDGKLNRLDGPAVTWNDNFEYWVNDKKHRLDGPAVFKNGKYEFWIDGKKVRETAFNAKVKDLTKD